jgi:hypothetical protein
LKASRDQILTAVTALSVVALALAEGGYSPRLTAALTIVVWWGVIAVLLIARAPGVAIPRAAVLAGCSLAGLSILAVISTGWASDDGRAVSDAVRTAGYAGLFALVVLVSRPGEWRPWLHGLALGLGVVAAVALATRFVPGFPGGDELIVEFIPSARGRLSDPIGYWNGLAACMAAGVVLFAWLAAAAQTRAGRSLAAAAIPLAAAVVYLASSRGGIAAAAVGLATLLALVPDRARTLASLVPPAIGSAVLVTVVSRQSDLVDGLVTSEASDQGTLMALLACVVCAGVAAVRWALDGGIARIEVSRGTARLAAGVLIVGLLAGLAAADLPRRLDEFNDPPAEQPATTGFVSSHLSSGSGSGRWQFWSAAVDAFAEEPVLGIGAGGYEGYWNRNGNIGQVVRDAHSIFLETLGELGVLGLLLLAGFLGAGIGAGALRSFGPADAEDEAAGGAVLLALLATGMASAAIDWTWEIPVVFALVVIAVALLTGPATLAASAATSKRIAFRPGSQGAFALGLATILVGWLAVCGSALVFLGESRLHESRSAAADGDLPEAARAAQDAASLEPWSAAPHVQLGLVQELQGDIAGGRQQLERAVELSPDDWAAYLVLTRLQTREGDLAASRRSLARARELNPLALSFTAPSP